SHAARPDHRRHGRPGPRLRARRRLLRPARRARRALLAGRPAPPRDRLALATGFMVPAVAVLIVGSVIWSGVFHPKEEELLKTLGSNEGTALLLASAVLTCVVAPICEEMLFRGYIFTALRNWKGTLPAALITAILFGGVHAGSAPALDLVPLAGLGFGLCLLYRYTGSLYPCIIAHSLNNSLAFSSLESWSWQTPVLMGTSLLAVGALAALFKRVGLISPVRGFTRVEA